MRFLYEWEVVLILQNIFHSHFHLLRGCPLVNLEGLLLIQEASVSLFTFPDKKHKMLISDQLVFWHHESIQSLW